MDNLFDTEASDTPEFDGFRQQYRIRSADVDPAGRASTSALVMLLQESAHADANRLGIGIKGLQDRGLTWYLKRLHLRLRRTPWIGETVEIETWPAAMERLHAIRDYRLFFDGGFDAVEIGTASSAWLVMDLTSGKPVRRPPKELTALHPETPRRALDVPFDKLPKITDDGDDGNGLEEDDDEGKPVLERPFPLRRADLDMNRHVNHGVFVDALLESVPPDLWCEAELLELEVDFLAEARPGDRLVTRCRRSAPGSEGGTQANSETDGQPRLLHDIVRIDDGRELVRARSRWDADSPSRRADHQAPKR